MNDLMYYVRRISARFTFAITVLVLAASRLSAQIPPNMPDDPGQAPLGGLGLLAAAGGAYALKKLRDRNRH